MTCHYSCSSCSLGFYLDYCLTCPSTRSLLSTVCICQTGYYEKQTSACVSSDLSSSFESGLINIANVAYYVAIGINLLSIILVVNRAYSIKAKKIIDCFQILALVTEYRYRQSEIAARSLKVLATFNFNYLNSLICTAASPPYGCTLFQNMIGPAFSLLLFVGLLGLLYFIARCVYQQPDSNVIYVGGHEDEDQRGGEISFRNFWISIYQSFLLVYLDQTIIQSTVAISRIVIINYYGFLLAIPFLVLLTWLIRLHFKTINGAQQYSLAYRARHHYFYFYDEFYHLNYIDHIFDGSNFSEESVEEDKKELRKAFYPQSNLMIMEILVKFLLAMSTIVFYEYEANLFAFCVLLFLFIYMLHMRSFFIYQRSDLFFSVLTLLITIFGFSTYWMPLIFDYFIFFGMISMLLVLLTLLIVSFLAWSRDKEGRIFKKSLQAVQDQQNKQQLIQDNHNSSENQIIKAKSQQSYEVSHQNFHQGAKETLHQIQSKQSESYQKSKDHLLRTEDPLKKIEISLNHQELDEQFQDEQPIEPRHLIGTPFSRKTNITRSNRFKVSSKQITKKNNFQNQESIISETKQLLKGQKVSKKEEKEFTKEEMVEKSLKDINIRSLKNEELGEKLSKKSEKPQRKEEMQERSNIFQRQKSSNVFDI